MKEVVPHLHRERSCELTPEAGGAWLSHPISDHDRPADKLAAHPLFHLNWHTRAAFGEPEDDTLVAG